ncbi:Trk system potassium transporter TrkA [Butyrivibrio sp. MC2013]|uniref:Trk system potassium transporter TrkA n=1 Tax=Butyrivibrio sp. MC2013 TaxID=1280686 RepID=UPI00041A4865|nr:Trk system potassium transporter TrkA [Butyrivibrio sp. MC2013]
MQIIIVGCGNVGRTLTEALSKEGHNITVIEEDSDVVKKVVNRLDVMGIVGNGVSFSILKDAGIETADLMIAVTDSDERNLLSCLIARKAGKCNTIARVRGHEYAKEIGFIKDELGLSMVINPEYALASEAARLLKFPSANKIETFAKGKAELVRMTVSEDSKLCNRSLKDINKEMNLPVLIGMVKRGEDVFIPDGSFILHDKDEISVIGTPRKMIAFFRMMGKPTAGVHSATIVGGGQTCFYLAQMLLSYGINVKIFENDPARCDELAAALPEAVVIEADGTDRNELLEENLAGTESFVVLTGVDEENIMLSLYAATVTRAKRIIRVHRPGYNELIGTLDVGSVLNPRNITAEKILQYVRGMTNSLGSQQIESLYRMYGERVEAIEFVIPAGSPVTGIPLAELKIKKGVLIACINHEGDIIMPTGSSRIQAGDSVIILTTHMGFDEIEDILDRAQ